MNLGFAFSLFSAFLVFGSRASAASCDGSTVEMLECIGRQIDSQEQGIAAKTAKILSVLEANKTDGDGTPADYDQAQQALKSANTKFDEAAQLQCQAEAALETVTGSLGRLVGADCLLQQKTTRNSQLRRLLKSHR
jgi:hypothetical protein